MTASAKNYLTYENVRNLFERTYLLNRTHNSPDFSKALTEIQKWIGENGFRGKARIIDVPAGNEYNYWKIPQRWHIRHFALKRTNGAVIVDRSSHPLTLVPFSNSFSGRLTRDALMKHIHVREDLPDAIPFVFRKMYRHWEESWGFAMPENLRKTLTDDEYIVEIDTEFTNEPMQMIEYTVTGKSDRHIHMAGHLDHPGQCNDSLSGCYSALWAVKKLEERYAQTEFTYSVWIGPEIVGSAVYLDIEKELAKKIAYCLCTNQLAHDAELAVCLSKKSDSMLDRAMQLAVLSRGASHKVAKWHKYPDVGDEISYDAPGLNIPTTTLSRIAEKFPFYHTSSDNLNIIDQGRARFEEAVDIMTDALTIMERNAIPVRKFTGNPSLANPRLNLYLDPTNMGNRLNLSSNREVRNLMTHQVLDLRNFQEFFLSNLEGDASLLDMAFESKMPFDFIAAYAYAAAEKGLIELRKGLIEGTYTRNVVPVSLTLSGELELQ